MLELIGTSSKQWNDSRDKSDKKCQKIVALGGVARCRMGSSKESQEDVRLAAEHPWSNNPPMIPVIYSTECG
jgi:hypothetical protein